MWPNVLLHAIPIQHGAESDPWIVGALVVAGVAAAVAIGTVLASLLLARERWRGPLAAAIAGALLFLLFDLLKESASLGQGLLARPLLQLALLAAFAAGLLLLPAFARSTGSGEAVAVLWAVGIAAHSAGEGWVVGTEALAADVAAPLSAASFLAHKLIEGASIPVVAGLALRAPTALRATTMVTLAAAGGFVAGLRLGPGIGPMVAFAAGAGAVAYAALLAARRTPLDARHAAWLLAGVAAVYVAGVLHEI